MKLLVRLTLLPLFVVVANCANDATLDPAAAPQYNLESAKLERLARYQSGPLRITIGLASKTIGPSGGTISLAGFEVVVPPGAVLEPTRFSIRLPVDPHGSEYVRAKFGPHGHFRVPVTLRLPLKGTTAEASSDPHVLWWDGTDWVPFATRVTTDGRIETQTSHFSEYGTEEGTNKGVILGNRPCARACAK